MLPPALVQPQSSVAYRTILLGMGHPSNWTHPKAQHQFPGSEPSTVLTAVGRHQSMTSFSPKWANAQLGKWELQDTEAGSRYWPEVSRLEWKHDGPHAVQYGSRQPHVAAKHWRSEPRCAVSISIFRVSTKNRNLVNHFYIDCMLK